MLNKIYLFVNKSKGIFVGLAVSLCFFVSKTLAQGYAQAEYGVEVDITKMQALYGGPYGFSPSPRSLSETFIYFLKIFWLPIVVVLALIVGSVVLIIKLRRRRAIKNKLNIKV